MPFMVIEPFRNQNGSADLQVRIMIKRACECA